MFLTNLYSEERRETIDELELGIRKKRSWPNRGTFSSFSWRNWEEYHKMWQNRR